MYVSVKVLNASFYKMTWTNNKMNIFEYLHLSNRLILKTLLYVYFIRCDYGSFY